VKTATILCQFLLILLSGCLCHDDIEQEEPPYLAPENIHATCGDYADRVVITWDAVEYAELYYIYRSGAACEVVDYIGETTELSFTDTDVKDGYFYYYQVQAYCDSKGYSDYSQMAAGHTLKVGDNWASLSSMSWFRSRSLYQSVIFDDKLWVIGGFNGYQNYVNTATFDSGNFINDIWYTDDAVNWYLATEHPVFENISNHASAACVYDGRIWNIGGRSLDTTYNDDVWYSYDGTDWHRATNSPGFCGRAGHKAVSFDGYMWVIGGCIGMGFENDVWRSTNGVDWELVTPPRWRYDMSYSVGDIVTHYNSHYTCIVDHGPSYPFNAADWAHVRDIFTSRTLFELRVFNNEMWLIGGMSCSYSSSPSSYGLITGYFYSSEVWHSSDGLVWDKVPPAGIGFGTRAVFASAVHDGKLWINGGEYGIPAVGVLMVTGDGSETSMPYPPSSPHYSSVNDPGEIDGDITRVSTEGGPPSGGTYRDLYEVEDNPLAWGGYIASIEVFVSVRRSGSSANARAAIMTNGSIFESTDLDPIISTTGNYEGRTYTWTDNPDTGVPWTWAEITDLEVGVTLVSYGTIEYTHDAYCTAVCLRVHFDDESPYTFGRRDDTWSSSDGITWNPVSFNSEVIPRRGHTMESFKDKLIMLTGEGADRWAWDIWYR